MKGVKYRMAVLNVIKCYGPLNVFHYIIFSRLAQRNLLFIFYKGAVQISEKHVYVGETVFLEYNKDHTIDLPKSITDTLSAVIIKRGGATIWSQQLRDGGSFNVSSTLAIKDEVKLVLTNSDWKFFAYVIFFDDDAAWSKCAELCQCNSETTVFQNHFTASSENTSKV